MAQGDGNYVTVAEIAWPSGWSDEQEAEAIAKWETYLERICRDVFYPQERVLLLDGNGRDTLPHGQTSALIEVTSLAIDDEEVAEADFHYDSWSVHLMSIAGGEPARFSVGHCNVQLSGTFGWDEAPEAVRSAVKILIERELELCGEASPSPVRTEHLASERIGDYSYRRDPRQPYLTGVAEVDRLIRPYVRYGPFPQSV